MRLIDADDMLNHIGAIHNAVSPHREYGYKEIMQEMRQRARHSQVEAIPIEWIADYLQKIADDDDEMSQMASIGNMLMVWLMLKLDTKEGEENEID